MLILNRKALVSMWSTVWEENESVNIECSILPLVLFFSGLDDKQQYLCRFSAKKTSTPSSSPFFDCRLERREVKFAHRFGVAFSLSLFGLRTHSAVHYFLPHEKLSTLIDSRKKVKEFFLIPALLFVSEYLPNSCERDKSYWQDKREKPQSVNNITSDLDWWKTDSLCRLISFTYNSPANGKWTSNERTIWFQGR